MKTNRPNELSTGTIVVQAVPDDEGRPVLAIIAETADGDVIGGEELPSRATPGEIMAAVQHVERVHLGGRLAELRLSMRAMTALANAGIDTVAQVGVLSDAELRAAGLGPRSTKEVRAALIHWSSQDPTR